MTPTYTDPLVTVYEGDCLDVMRELPDASVDAVVTDPPYGLMFMGKHWDHGVPGVDFWLEMYRALKPGGYLLSFAGTRTVHRFGVAIEDAGFEIRDTLMWIYASGFPKSLDVSKALDKAAGAEREVVGPYPEARRKPNGSASATSVGLGPRPGSEMNITAPATDLARKWEGWGTALKPAHEPIVMARKPLVGTVAQNVTRYGTGALNIDVCRIGVDGGHEGAGPGPSRGILGEGLNGVRAQPVPGLGRWPSNVLLSDPELFDEPNPYVVGSGATAGASGQVEVQRATSGFGGGGGEREFPFYADSGGYSRFYAIPRYPVALIIPKADRAERERGLGEATGERVFMGSSGRTYRDGEWHETHSEPRKRANVHPTVKPIDLMRHLVRLVTPPGGVVLDPFAGSGTTGLAASEEGFRSILIEREHEYVEIILGRLMATPMGLGLDVA